MPFKSPEAQRAYKREWYKNSSTARSKQNKSNAAWKKSLLDNYLAWKATLSCVICGESDSACLDFHHIDPAEKEYSVANLARVAAFKTLLKEVEKCAVLCANCHRKHHAGTLSSEQSGLIVKGTSR